MFNPVAKYAHKVNKSGTYKVKKQYTRKVKYRGKDYVGNQVDSRVLF